jgi:hypothetical protein
MWKEMMTKGRTEGGEGRRGEIRSRTARRALAQQEES